MIPGLWDCLEHHATGNRVAIRAQRGDLTFETLLRVALHLERELKAHTLPFAEPIGLSLPNGLAFVPALAALWKRGHPVALVSPRYSTSELGAIVSGTGIRTFLTTPAHAGRMSIPDRAWHATELSLSELGEKIVLIRTEPLPGDPGRRHPLAEGAALFKFTSGSTGEPKGIALGPDQVKAEADNVVQTLGISPEDRILADVPLFHSYGFDLGVLPRVFSGARLVLQDFFVPQRIAGDLEREGISVYLGVPNQYRRWIEGAPSADRPVASVRYLLSCTAPLDAETILAFHDRFAMALCQHYGSSETGAAANQLPSEVRARPGSVGVPMKNVRIRVLDEAGREVAPGEVGEVEVHSGAVARGYILGAPSERTPFRENGFLIGDLAVRDADGFLYLKGRVDQLLNVGGLKVSPEEMVRVLQSHPAVREAGVVGVLDPTGETAVTAMVGLKAPVTEKELIAWCFGRLADYKVPRRIHLKDELPRGPSGKVRIRPEDAPL